MRLLTIAFCLVFVACSAGPPSVERARGDGIDESDSETETATDSDSDSDSETDSDGVCVSFGRDLRGYPTGTPMATLELAARGDADSLRQFAAPAPPLITLNGSALHARFEGSNAQLRCERSIAGLVRSTGSLPQGGPIVLVIESCGPCNERRTGAREAEARGLLRPRLR